MLFGPTDVSALTLQSLLFSISLLFAFSDFPCFSLRFFLPFPRILGVPRREKPLLFSGKNPCFSKKARVGGSGRFFGCSVSTSPGPNWHLFRFPTVSMSGIRHLVSWPTRLQHFCTGFSSFLLSQLPTPGDCSQNQPITSQLRNSPGIVFISAGRCQLFGGPPPVLLLSLLCMA